MKKLIAALVAALFVMGSAFAQAPEAAVMAPSAPHHVKHHVKKHHVKHHGKKHHVKKHHAV